MADKIIFARIVTPNSGHLADVARFAKKRAAAIKKTLGIEVTLSTRVGGPAGQLLMHSTHKDMGEVEKIRRKVMKAVLAGDIPQPKPGWVKSVEDRIWMEI